MSGVVATKEEAYVLRGVVAMIENLSLLRDALILARKAMRERRSYCEMHEQALEQWDVEDYEIDEVISQYDQRAKEGGEG